MKNLILNVVIKALEFFSSFITDKVDSKSLKRSIELLVKRVVLLGRALTDADPDDKAQIEVIVRQTLLSPEFVELEKQVTTDLVAKIENEKLATLLSETDDLRLKLFAALGDDDTQNGEQIKLLLEDFLKSEQFDTVAISMAELLAEKYAKNPLAKEFFISLVKSLVNSDDQV